MKTSFSTFVVLVGGVAAQSLGDLPQCGVSPPPRHRWLSWALLHSSPPPLPIAPEFLPNLSVFRRLGDIFVFYFPSPLIQEPLYLSSQHASPSDLTT